MTSWGFRLRGALASIVLVASISTTAIAEDSATVKDDEFRHPLAWTLRYATSRSDYIRKHIRDYSCRLIKRERIDGELQGYQFAQAQVRCEQRRDGKVVQPMAVFIQFLAPARLKGRRVLYVDGENDGMMLVRKGGGALNYLKLKIDPNSATARRDSNYPITDIGFDKIIERLIQLAKDDIEHDPTATNTQVSHFLDAKVNDRVCTHIRVVHPERGEGIVFHRASLYIDDELHVPIRLVVYDWPDGEGQEPPLIEEYTYVDLRINVGLTDADFSKEKLESSTKRPTATSASVSK